MTVLTFLLSLALGIALTHCRKDHVEHYDPDEDEEEIQQ